MKSWEEAVAYACSLPDTMLSTSYGKPAVKVASNQRAFLYTGHEDKSSFGIAIDLDTVEIDRDPETFWQSPHYEGYPAVLIRFDSADPDRVRAMIERSRDWTAARKPVKPRKK